MEIPSTILDTLAKLQLQGQFLTLNKALNEFPSGYFKDLLTQVTERGCTLFAPTDAAFRKLPKIYRTFPMDEKTKLELYRILRYHIVPRAVRSKRLGRSAKLNTLLGKQLQINNPKGPGFFVNQKSRVVESDVRCSNGVIHAVNTVLIPN